MREATFERTTFARNKPKRETERQRDRETEVQRDREMWANGSIGNLS